MPQPKTLPEIEGTKTESLTRLQKNPLGEQAGEPAACKWFCKSCSANKRKLSRFEGASEPL